MKNRLARKSKTRLASLTSLEKQADRLFQEKLIKLKPKSCVSGLPTEVIHHFIPKSQSRYLRYDMKNGVPLTHAEHFAHHTKGDPTISHAIEAYYGQQWFDDLQVRRRLFAKKNKGILEAVISELQKL